MQRVNNTRSSHILSLPRILREANDPFVMTIQIVSFLEISWRLLIRCYRKILVEFPTYPDPP